MGEKELDNQRVWLPNVGAAVVPVLSLVLCRVLHVQMHWQLSATNDFFLTFSLSPSLPPSSGHKDCCASLHEVQKCIHAPFT